MTRALLIPAIGGYSVVHTDGTYQSTRTMINGPNTMLESLTKPPYLYAIIDEEGKLNGSPINAAATSLCTVLQVGLSPLDMIRGNMLCFGPVNSVGEHTDIPSDTLKHLIKILELHSSITEANP